MKNSAAAVHCAQRPPYFLDVGCLESVADAQRGNEGMQLIVAADGAGGGESGSGSLSCGGFGSKPLAHKLTYDRVIDHILIGAGGILAARSGHIHK